MTENTPDTSGWTAPTREQALTAVRDILRDNPERWYQGWWLSNEFDIEEYELFDHPSRRPVITTGELARFATEPVPQEPEDPGLPLCGTKACIAGWLAIVASPPGSVITSSSSLLLPDNGGTWSIPKVAAEIAGLSEEQEDFLFSGDRSDVDEIIEALDRLIADRDAEIWQPSEG